MQRMEIAGSLHMLKAAAPGLFLQKASDFHTPLLSTPSKDWSVRQLRVSPLPLIGAATLAGLNSGAYSAGQLSGVIVANA